MLLPAAVPRQAAVAPTGRIWKNFEGAPSDGAMSEPEQQESNGAPIKANKQELFHAPANLHEQTPGAESGVGQAKKSSGFLIVLLGLVIVAAGAVLVLSQKGLKSAKAASDTDDLGAGIANASGLRGHLVTRWQGKTQYMLKIEPIDPRDADRFASVTAHPSKPIAINIRLLDSSGFALCGKEIVLPYEAKNEVQTNGADVFTNILGSEGKVEALWAQGELPCSPDQYQRFDYWDLSTNFPTLAEQDQALGHRHAETASADESAADHEARGRAKRKMPARTQSAYLMQGDDRATEFDAARGLLVVGTSTRFLISQKSDEQVAAGWADDDSLIHFTCDSHANCSLKRAGSASVVPARMNE
jgi:hypothetical protein